MSCFDDDFHEASINRSVHAFQEIQDTNNLEVQFQLW